MSKLPKAAFAATLIFLFSTQAFGAEDTLRSLQEDVLLAKEKSAAISGKMSTVTGALDDAKAHLVEKEAKQMVQAVDASGGASTPIAEPPPKKSTKKIYKPTFLDQQEAAAPARVPTAIPAENL